MPIGGGVDRTKLASGCALALGAVVLGGAGSPAPATPCVPRLTSRAPVTGETVRAPLEIRFRVRCFRLGPAPYGHIHAWVGKRGESRRYELRPRRQTGI